MKVICVDQSDLEKVALALKEVCKFLSEGKIIVYPTDTLYGLGCDATNEQAVKKLYVLKKRNESKPVSVIVESVQAIRKIAYLDQKNKKIAERLLPGPYTLIFPGAKNLPKAITAGKNSIGVRIPNNEICRQIMAVFRKPIVATSVNISGEEALNDPFKIVDYFKDKSLTPDLILDCGKIEKTQASIIVDLTQKSPQILRAGARSPKEIMELLKKLNYS